ncbi:SDR family oxidoreductase [Aerophototrophica crusticola]|uniref:SDR family oxidoreductase n=1 Tax=Aerophototrophica crusticola TaxID=1709002 RepID=A0A858R3B1_9PROT|nr:SDR family oxidoreductase [Rhodospirillaceae bacterium B3]
MGAELEFAGKVALVTGGSRGIGAATVRALAAKGAAVAFSYAASAGAAEALVAELRGKGAEVTAYRADSADPAAVAELVRAVHAAFGRLDILVNNAGVFLGGPVDQMDEAESLRQWTINVVAVQAAVKAAVPLLPEGGAIVTTGSVLGRRVPLAGVSAYAASKAAVANLSRGWARDLAPRGIRVNVVQPGPIDTDMNPADGDLASVVRPLTAMQRYGKPEEVAAAILFLASPAASYITGVALDVDGGMEA